MAGSPGAAPRVAIVQAPSILGQFPGGVETAPDTLLRLGLAERLAARRAGEVTPPPYDATVDPATGVRNPHGIAAYTVALADAVTGVLDRGEFWVHVDVDVLDDDVMPALDYRMGGGGLTMQELAAVIRAAVTSGLAMGLEITNFNAVIDTDGLAAHDLVDMLERGLAHRGPGTMLGG